MSNEFNTVAQPRMVCPHCGGTFEHDNIQYVDLSGASEFYDCEHCDKAFEVKAEITVKYTTIKMFE